MSIDPETHRRHRYGKHGRPRLICVIPCHNEPDPLMTLESLVGCQQPDGPVEVMVVVNGSEADDDDVRRRNQQSVELLEFWARTHADCFFKLWIRYYPDLPRRHAGVGLARRLGMDEACERLLQTSAQCPGIIVALDADCRVAPDYFVALVQHFTIHSGMVGGSIYFQHPLEGLSADHRRGIVGYELHLRIYRQGQRYAGFPHAFHTVGSAMAVRADVYRRLGGMNLRKAGEDFYFLQKVMAHGPFSDITTTTVFPSARLSNRVPFGTGRAMTHWHQGDEDRFTTYDIRIYQELRPFFQSVRAMAHDKNVTLTAASDCLKEFLVQHHVERAIKEIRFNTATPQSFEKRFFLWFNPFKLLKYVHFASDKCYQNISVQQAGTNLLAWMGMTSEAGIGDDEALLERLRRLDRETNDGAEGVR
ncbi:MAG: glycosyltransferase [Magnetococcales bacterium]|nr:glycosyltransferase [Magnetococcales bacterium]